MGMQFGRKLPGILFILVFLSISIITADLLHVDIERGLYNQVLFSEVKSLYDIIFSLAPSNLFERELEVGGVFYGKYEYNDKSFESPSYKKHRFGTFTGEVTDVSGSSSPYFDLNLPFLLAEHAEDNMYYVSPMTLAPASTFLLDIADISTRILKQSVHDSDSETKMNINGSFIHNLYKSSSHAFPLLVRHYPHHRSLTHLLMSALGYLHLTGDSRATNLLGLMFASGVVDIGGIGCSGGLTSVNSFEDTQSNTTQTEYTQMEPLYDCGLPEQGWYFVNGGYSFPSVIGNATLIHLHTDSHPDSQSNTSNPSKPSSTLNYTYKVSQLLLFLQPTHMMPLHLNSVSPLSHITPQSSHAFIRLLRSSISMAPSSPHYASSYASHTLSAIELVDDVAVQSTARSLSERLALSTGLHVDSVEGVVGSVVSITMKLTSRLRTLSNVLSNSVLNSSPFTPSDGSSSLSIADTTSYSLVDVNDVILLPPLKHSNTNTNTKTNTNTDSNIGDDSDITSLYGRPLSPLARNSYFTRLIPHVRVPTHYSYVPSIKLAVEMFKVGYALKNSDSVFFFALLSDTLMISPDDLALDELGDAALSQSVSLSSQSGEELRKREKGKKVGGNKKRERDVEDKEREKMTKMAEKSTQDHLAQQQFQIDTPNEFSDLLDISDVVDKSVESVHGVDKNIGHKTVDNGKNSVDQNTPDVTSTGDDVDNGVGVDLLPHLLGDSEIFDPHKRFDNHLTHAAPMLDLDDAQLHHYLSSSTSEPSSPHTHHTASSNQASPHGSPLGSPHKNHSITDVEGINLSKQLIRMFDPFFTFPSPSNTENSSDTASASKRMALHLLLSSAAQGNVHANMAFAFKYYSGGGVKKSCEGAAHLYSRVLKSIFDTYVYSYTNEASLWTHEESIRLSSGLIPTAKRLFGFEIDGDAGHGEKTSMPEYLDYNIQLLLSSGSPQSIASVTTLLYYGGRGVVRNVPYALHVARLGVKKGDKASAAFILQHNMLMDEPLDRASLELVMEGVDDTLVHSLIHPKHELYISQSHRPPKSNDLLLSYINTASRVTFSYSFSEFLNDLTSIFDDETPASIPPITPSPSPSPSDNKIDNMKEVIVALRKQTRLHSASAFHILALLHLHGVGPGGRYRVEGDSGVGSSASASSWKKPIVIKKKPVSAYYLLLVASEMGNVPAAYELGTFLLDPNQYRPVTSSASSFNSTLNTNSNTHTHTASNNNPSSSSSTSTSTNPSASTVDSPLSNTNSNTNTNTNSTVKSLSSSSTSISEETEPKEAEPIYINYNSPLAASLSYNSIMDSRPVIIFPRKNYSGAANLLNKAANARHHKAIYNLALMYLNGLGTNQVCSGAVKMLKLAAEHMYYRCIDRDSCDLKPHSNSSSNSSSISQAISQSFHYKFSRKAFELVASERSPNALVMYEALGYLGHEHSITNTATLLNYRYHSKYHTLTVDELYSDALKYNTHYNDLFASHSQSQSQSHSQSQSLMTTNLNDSISEWCPDFNLGLFPSVSHQAGGAGQIESQLTVRKYYLLANKGKLPSNPLPTPSSPHLSLISQQSPEIQVSLAHLSARHLYPSSFSLYSHAVKRLFVFPLISRLDTVLSLVDSLVAYFIDSLMSFFFTAVDCVVNFNVSSVIDSVVNFNVSSVMNSVVSFLDFDYIGYFTTPNTSTDISSLSPSIIPSMASLMFANTCRAYTHKINLLLSSPSHTHFSPSLHTIHLTDLLSQSAILGNVESHRLLGDLQLYHSSQPFYAHRVYTVSEKLGDVFSSAQQLELTRLGIPDLIAVEYQEYCQNIAHYNSIFYSNPTAFNNILGDVSLKLNSTSLHTNSEFETIPSKEDFTVNVDVPSDNMHSSLSEGNITQNTSQDGNTTSVASDISENLFLQSVALSSVEAYIGVKNTVTSKTLTVGASLPRMLSLPLAFPLPGDCSPASLKTLAHLYVMVPQINHDRVLNIATDHEGTNVKLRGTRLYTQITVYLHVLLDHLRAYFSYVQIHIDDSSVKNTTTPGSSDNLLNENFVLQVDAKVSLKRVTGPFSFLEWLNSDITVQTKSNIWDMLFGLKQQKQEKKGLKLLKKLKTELERNQQSDDEATDPSDSSDPATDSETTSSSDKSDTKIDKNGKNGKQSKKSKKSSHDDQVRASMIRKIEQGEELDLTDEELMMLMNEVLRDYFGIAIEDIFEHFLILVSVLFVLVVILLLYARRQRLRLQRRI